MHVHLGFGGDVHVDHRFQFGDVQPARGHIGGHQHRAAALREAHQHLVALALVQVAVQLQRHDALRLQHRHQVAALLFGVAKGQGALGAEMVQCQAHGVQALVFGHFVEALLDLLGAVRLLQRHGHRFALVARGQLGHVWRVGGGKQQRLPLGCGREVARHGRDVVCEAHVQHAVGLIQHPGVHRVQRQAAALKVVQDAAGRAHHDVRAVLQARQLRPHGGPTTQGEHLDVVFGPRQASNLLGDLVGQFAGGAQHQGLHRQAPRVQVGQQRQAEGCGLAAAGLGLRDQVFAGQGQGQAGGLDRGHPGIAQLPQVGQHMGRQRQGREVQGRGGLHPRRRA